MNSQVPFHQKTRQLDERVIQSRHRIAGYLGPWSSSFTLAWLATHRDRLRTLILGGKRLSVFVVWDTKGAELAARSEADVEAVRQLVQGSGGVLAVIDRIEREQYVNGMRCSDFKEALDAVREALT